MTTRQRIDLLARAYPRLFPRVELLRFVRAQLGHVEALDGWFVRDGIRVRARAPKTIFHICAGNLAVSAWTSIAHGLILGARNIVKLPGDREDASGREEIVRFINGLPSPLRKLVETTRSAGSMLTSRPDVVIAFGSDATMDRLYPQLSWRHKFITHGHAVSLLYLGEPDRLTPRQVRACAIDVLTYDQLGCLSPQAIYVPPRSDIDALGRKLASALETEWNKIVRKPGRPLGTAARMAEARDMAHALGQRAWLPNHLGWSVIHDPEPTFQPSPLHGTIYLREASAAQLPAALSSVKGLISTVGLIGDLNSRLENVFLSLGVSRFCKAGRMQFPPLTWHHDGRATLGELVTWVDAESPA
jgi:hypothetical protein